MDLAILQTIARELHEILSGSFVHKVHQPLPREIVLRTRKPGGPEKKLAISADPALGRIHLTNLRIPNPPAPPRFCAFLRAHFQGSRILGVESDRDDRVVHIIAARGREPDRREMDLVLELLGRDSNIILVDRRTNIILECLHRIPEKETGFRPVLPGSEYEPPPRRDRGQIVSESLSVTPGLSIGSDGKKRLSLKATELQDEQFPSMNLAADAYYSPKLERIVPDALRRELTAPLMAQLRSLERRVEKIKLDAQRLQGMTDLVTDGELLKGNLHQVKKGMTRLTVPDWEGGSTRTIVLDPKLGPVRNMEKLFKRAAKGKRGEKKVRERLSQTMEEERVLRDLLYLIEGAREVEALEALAEDVQRITARARSVRTREAVPTQKSEQVPFRRIRTPQGREVFVGKSARGNDFILRHKARKGDLWFHVKDFAGAHALLPARTKEPIPIEEQEFAAALAVHFSKAQGKGKVEVIVADVADLGRPDRCLPGQVTVREYRTILSEGLPEDQIPEESRTALSSSEGSSNRKQGKGRRIP
jgi:predicted ribosome quality control (RQC) complex YloA/Tae2 family protein